MCLRQSGEECIGSYSGGHTLGYGIVPLGYRFCRWSVERLNAFCAVVTLYISDCSECSDSRCSENSRAGGTCIYLTPNLNLSLGRPPARTRIMRHDQSTFSSQHHLTRSNLYRGAESTFGIQCTLYYMRKSQRNKRSM